MDVSYTVNRRAAEIGIDQLVQFPPSFYAAAGVDAAYADVLGKKPPSSLISERPYPDVEHARLAFIGACAGGLAAAYLVQRGFTSENMHLIDPQGRYAGMWETPLADGGINNPKPLYFPPNHELVLGNRNGFRMRNFIRGITNTHLQSATFVEDNVVNLSHRKSDNMWEVRTAKDQTIEADYVVISTGTPKPRKIGGNRLKSNLDTITDTVPEELLKLERWQRTITDEEFASGRHLVLIGLGNSTGTMLRQIYDYQDRTGETVNFSVITDYPGAAVKSPYGALPGQKSIFRKVSQDYFTGYSGDLDKDNEVYFRALKDDRIIYSATAVNFDTKTDKLRIDSRERKSLHIEAPHIFALVGYERDSTLFKAVGAQILKGAIRKNQIGPHIREDGALWTEHLGYGSNLLAIGAVAATREHPAAAVVPKIVATLPSLALTVAVREYGRQHRNDSRRSRSRR